MGVLSVLCVAAAFGLNGGGLRESHLKGSSSAQSFVKALEFKRHLRVCNAYPYPTALDVFRGAEHLTSDSPMEFKACRDFETAMAPGDKLVFKVGEANAGTFSVSDLPNNDATLLLTIYRHDTLSTAVSFESHVYANLLNAQVALVDTYKGDERATLKIQDHSEATSTRSEDLTFDRVVAVNPGKYDVMLVDAAGETVAQDELVALNRESYIIMRTGVKAQQGTSYTQEVTVYPRSDSSLLGFASMGGMWLVAMLFSQM